MKLTTRVPTDMPYGFFELETKSVEEMIKELTLLSQKGSLAAKNFLANEFNIK